jgi:hypothetical protein
MFEFVLFKFSKRLSLFSLNLGPSAQWRPGLCRPAPQMPDRLPNLVQERVPRPETHQTVAGSKEGVWRLSDQTRGQEEGH